MNKAIINHLFEFWTQIGKQGGFLTKENGLLFTNPLNNSWPSKVFDIDHEKLDIDDLRRKIGFGAIPNSIATYEDDTIKTILESHQFRRSSKIKAMALDTFGVLFEDINETEFITVSTNDEAKTFADVASESFGYPVKASTIIPLIDKPSFKIILGKHDKGIPTCGMVYIDENGVAGIHMIGTKGAYRGLGLGKKMTQFLINQSIKAQSRKVFLVASEAGERIYTKMGFTSHGFLESYSLPLE
ncbi:GNAT family N-acetyltransferase [[Muricauda] lutisoli]|uniref:GNAT family N-acetyltransferase n=1 Tax=[Muricauda] lutisoli TaxID=2816035 RepID=A0ABS3EVS5_9FLAO|nr:GNAT family N-acetyltransferase [[Muricauda] lutisoli]MBO0330294.1 GNAT family N-acetyltransferase [[Muricauda] lutisoli]